MKRPTIRDVASRAGVSHQTVSRVLNADPRVVDPTRERVLAAIRDLDYVPNGVARSLASNRTGTLGVVTSDLSSYGVAELVAGVEAEAGQQGYVLLIGSAAPVPAPDRRRQLGLMIERGVDGLIVAWPSLRLEDRQALTQAAARLPLVTASSQDGLPGVGIVGIDNRGGAAAATAYLLARGHRSIATIAGPDRWSAAEARLLGYCDALRATGLEADPGLIERADDWEPDSGQRAADRLLARGARFTALFAQNDLLALGAITALRGAGLRVPDDVSVVGFDDIPLARHLDPPLTTMRQPMRDLGRLAAGLVIDRLGHPRGEWPSDPSHHRFPVVLVERSSVGNAPR